MELEPTTLERRLRDEFGATDAEVRVVVRQATDLADSGQYERDVGVPLTAAVVVDELGDAPDEPVVDRWNWWLGSLELAFGDYARFGVQGYRTE